MSAPLTSLKVSCLLVNYFGAATLAKALQSVFVQQLSNASVQIELDVVVVDNSVNAQEAQLLQTTIAATKPSKPTLRLVTIISPMVFMQKRAPMNFQPEELPLRFWCASKTLRLACWPK
jgi:hypothetical protein